MEIKESDTLKSFGLYWKLYGGNFHFNITIGSQQTKSTKRTLHSDLNKIFDSFGFLTPALLKGKISVQKIWALKIDWDNSLSSEHQEKWNKFIGELEI